MSILLSENELYKLHQRSKWDDEKGDWTIPHFTFNPKTKDVAFPTINAKARNEQQKDDREIAIYEHNDQNTSRKKTTNRKKNNESMNKTGLNGEAYKQNLSADGRSNNGGESWMEDRS
jgi:hypothetical protein